MPIYGLLNAVSGMSELKSCPFCGGDAQLDHSQVGFGVYSKVRCIKCHCSTKNFGISTKVSSDELAIEAWNKRVGEQGE